MTGVLNFNEYPPEKVFEAQDMYCVDRLTYEAVSSRTGVSVATLKRWADKYEWRRKREELARVESDIRFNTYKARATMLAKVIEGGGALDAFAVAKLETMIIDQARFKNELGLDKAPVPVKIESPAQAAELLENALAVKMGSLLSAPETLNLKVIKEYREALNTLTEMRGQAADENLKQTGLSLESEEKIIAILKGDL